MRMIEKKNLKFELKMTNVYFAKNKKNDQKFERIMTKNKKLLELIKLIKFVVII